MSDAGHPPFDMKRLLDFFPGDAALVARLHSESAGFRSICEDLMLAHGALVRLESLQHKQQPSEIAEYRQLVAELRNEVLKALEKCRPI